MMDLGCVLLVFLLAAIYLSWLCASWTGGQAWVCYLHTKERVVTVQIFLQRRENRSMDVCHRRQVLWSALESEVQHVFQIPSWCFRLGKTVNSGQKIWVIASCRVLWHDFMFFVVVCNLEKEISARKYKPVLVRSVWFWLCSLRWWDCNAKWAHIVG